MNIKLVLNTPDLSIGGNVPKRSIDLTDKDYRNKSIKEIITNYIFIEILQGQDESIIEQAIELIFNFIQPKDIENITDWWQQPFEQLIQKNSKEVILNLEFSPEGLAFMQQMM
ncbi:MAG: hypothetical protein JXA54_01820 [Candidatus Heimdallarchaeota archaeon]|nr:hypothetical protein [Candidatus Heimdallarchaeota archaeon]